MSFRFLSRAAVTSHGARRSYVTINTPGSFPRPGMPGGTWSETGRNGAWQVVSSCKNDAGVWGVTTSAVPFAFCEMENVNGQLKVAKSFAAASQVPTADGSVRNAYALLGGSFTKTSLGSALVFQAEVKTAEGNYVSASIGVSGDDPVELENVNGTLVKK